LKRREEILTRSKRKNGAGLGKKRGVRGGVGERVWGKQGSFASQRKMVLGIQNQRGAPKKGGRFTHTEWSGRGKDVEMRKKETLSL